jgi:hypothetical protein
LIEPAPLNRRGGFFEAKINQKYEALNPKSTFAEASTDEF